MNGRSVSKDLAELAELIKLHHRSLGLDEEAALKQTVALVEQIGHRRHAVYLYQRQKQA